MKFFSKQNNYRVVLRPGMPREPLTGREAVPGIHVKFEGGVATVNNDEHIEMMMRHPAYGVDYIAEDSEDLKSFNGFKKDTEPIHTVAEVKYGNVENIKNPKPIGIAKDPNKMKEIQDIAMKITAEMLAKKEEDMKKQIIKDIKEGKISLDDVPNEEVPEMVSEEAPVETAEESDSVQVVDESKETFKKKELESEAEKLNKDKPLPENPNLTE